MYVEHNHGLYIMARLFKQVAQNELIALQTAFDPTSTANTQMETLLVTALDSVNPVSAPVTLGTGSDVVSLTMSEDMSRSTNAKVAFAVDGKPVGTETISALHSAGQSQVVDLQGSWGLGTHLVTVTLKNPGSGSNPVAIRAAYVTSISYDGATQSASTTKLTNATAHSFSVVSATTYSPGAVGGNLTTLGNDTVLLGNGAETINAMGPSVSVVGSAGMLTFVGSSGADSITAGQGSIYVTPGTNSLTFDVGSGSSTIASGMGQEVFDVVNGNAGGTLILSGFTPGKDVVHLVGFDGTGIKNQIIGHSSSQFTLTDNTTIIVGGLRDIGAGSVFG